VCRRTGGWTTANKNPLPAAQWIFLPVFFPNLVFEGLRIRKDSEVELVVLIPHHMRSALNPQCVIYPTHECLGTRATELGFQLELTNFAVEFFSFRLDILGGTDLSRPDDLVVIDEKH
jgi:hypothetical protein